MKRIRIRSLRVWWNLLVKQKIVKRRAMINETETRKPTGKSTRSTS